MSDRKQFLAFTARGPAVLKRLEFIEHHWVVAGFRSPPNLSVCRFYRTNKTAFRNSDPEISRRKHENLEHLARPGADGRRMVAHLSLAQTAVLKPATPIAASAPTAVPALVPYSGAVIAGDGKSFAAEAGVTFQIYKDEVGGEALWTETQTVAIDSTGHYKVQLGATNPNGLPSDLFASGEARWLEVQVAGEAPQPRVLLVSVPYALKAADATTLGGLPASAFALARSASEAVGAVSPAIMPNVTSNVTTTGGTLGFVPEFSGMSSVVDSPIFVNTTGEVGIGTATPTATLDVSAGFDARHADGADSWCRRPVPRPPPRDSIRNLSRCRPQPITPRPMRPCTLVSSGRPK